MSGASSSDSPSSSPAGRRRTRRLILASSSPRRKELLARLGVEFEVRGADVDESPAPGESPREMVRRLALVKARAVCRPGESALGADTTVAIGGESLGKPADAAEATRMLARLSNRSHEVWTGVALVAREHPRAGRGSDAPFERVEVGRTEVAFRALSPREIAAYVESGEPFDRAGAYAIQGGAASFVARIDGEFENVVGLPLSLVRSLLDELDAR